MPFSKFRPDLSGATLSSGRHMGSAAIALGLALALAGCGGIPGNRSMYSVHQPVVAHTSYSLDVTADSNGLSPDENRRLADWLGAMDLRYGDKVSLEDPLASEATRAQVASAVSHFGLLLRAESGATAGYVNAGTARVVIVRASATVPHCPDWSANNQANPKNALSSNYGCAVNSNLAAMIANPDDLLSGATSNGETSVQRASRAINAYNATPVSGTGGSLKVNSTKGGN